jgi:hypothetical protein
LDDHKKFKIKFPAAPGTIELEIMKTYKRTSKDNQLKPIIITTPGHLIQVDKQPEKTADQGAVQNMKKPIDNRTAFTQVPRQYR